MPAGYLCRDALAITSEVIDRAGAERYKSPLGSLDRFALLAMTDGVNNGGKRLCSMSI